MSDYYLIGKGVYKTKELEFNSDFTKDYGTEKRYSGLKSSKGGHSIQLICYNKEKYFIKFWLMGIKTAGIIHSMEKRGHNKTPYITLQYGNYSKGPLKEKAQSKSCTKITVNLEKFDLNTIKHECLIKGSLEADWSSNGNLQLQFNVLVKDIGLIP